MTDTLFKEVHYFLMARWSPFADVIRQDCMNLTGIASPFLGCGAFW